MTQESRLTVLFGGSCGFVPHEDGSRVRVLLPQRERGWPADDGKVIVPPHRAFMKFRMTAHDPSEAAPREPDFIYLDRGDPVGICFLEHETLALPKSLDSSLFLNYGSIKNPTAPTPVDSRSLDWVARIDTFCQQPKVDKAFLGPSLPISIAARLDIAAGVLETDLVPADEFALDPPPDPTKKPYQQCLAGMVRASSRIQGLTATIGSSSKASLRLSAIDSEIKLEIYNEVLDDIILNARFHRPALYKDFDFEMLYDLTKVSSSHRHLPLNLGVKPGGSKSGTGGDCKPAHFLPAVFHYQTNSRSRHGKRTSRRGRR
jgi:hypothetical protein